MNVRADYHVLYGNLCEGKQTVLPHFGYPLRVLRKVNIILAPPETNTLVPQLNNLSKIKHLIHKITMEFI